MIEAGRVNSSIVLDTNTLPAVLIVILIVKTLSDTPGKWQMPNYKDLHMTYNECLGT